MGKWGKKPPPPTRFQRATAWLKPKKKKPPTRIQRIVAAVKPAPKKEKKKIDWDKHLTRAQRGLSTGLKATSIAVKTTMLFNTREDPELVAGILRRAAEQELERRANKLRKKPPPKPPTCMDKLKCALGLKQPPPPKKTTWEKVKAAVGKKPPPPPPKKTAWDKMKSAVGIKPPPPPPPPPKKTAWQKVKAAVSKKPPPLPPRPPPKKTTWQKVASKVGVKARSDPELETMMRREAALALESRIDIAEHERRDLTSLIMREAEFVELD